MTDGSAVDVDQQRLIASLCGPVEQLLQRTLVGDRLDVEPSTEFGCACSDRLHRRRAEMRQSIGNACCQGRTGNGDFAVRVEKTRSPGRRQDDREGRRFAQHGRAQIEVLDCAPTRYEGPVGETRPVATQRNFVLGAAFDVVEDTARKAFRREPADVVDAVTCPGKSLRNRTSRALDVDE